MVPLAHGRVIGLDVYNTVSPTRNLCVRSAGPGIAIAFAGDTVATAAVAAGMAAAGMAVVTIAAADMATADMAAAGVAGAGIAAEGTAGAPASTASRALPTRFSLPPRTCPKSAVRQPYEQLDCGLLWPAASGLNAYS